MSGIKFKQTVLHAATILIEQGYQPNESNLDRRIIQFSKEMMPGVSCRIEFQLLYTSPVKTFNVRLDRIRLPNFTKDEHRYPYLTIDLPNLMWLVYGIEACPVGKFWEYTDEQGLHEQLIRAQIMLRDYGLKWLEDPLTQSPGFVPATERDAFRNMLTTVVAQDLESYGYELKKIADTDLPLFVKHLHGGLNALIEFTQRRILNPLRLEVAVCLYRGLTEDPYAHDKASYPGKIVIQLGALLRLRFSVGFSELPNLETVSYYPMEEGKSASVQEYPLEAWRYVDQTGLERQIKDILDKLKTHALPWLEDPNSQAPF